MSDRNIELKVSRLELDVIVASLDYEIDHNPAAVDILQEVYDRLSYLQDKYEDYGSDIDSCF